MALYPSIRIEGGLLGPDILDEVLTGDLQGQRAADFNLDNRRSVTDEIAAAFADARALWGVFQNRLERLPPDDSATSLTRDTWMIPFLGLLGYELRYNQKAYDIDGLTFAISHRAGEGSDSPPVHIVGARQELGRVPPSGRPRLAPHSLVQEYLNRTENLWGIVTNGFTLRLLRDCTFVRRQAYVEFDLPAILEEQRFQDFSAFYRLLHRSRLPHDIPGASECWLEKYYSHSVEQGGRVRDHLRDGVEQCMTTLANGFLSHPANQELHRRLSPSCTGNERITPETFYRQLLIVVYRFLFLLVSEDRGLLSADQLYRDHYSIGRLRRLLEKRAAFSDHDDLWQSLRVLWRLLVDDTPVPTFDNQPMASILGLPVLNGDLFAHQDLDDATLSNRDLLEALWRLAWYQDKPTSPPRRVNYAALDVEELGSVYESLLDFHPAIDTNHGGRLVFSFVAGSERKTTGSYYTPPELVGELIRSALEPVLEERLRQARESGGGGTGSKGRGNREQTREEQALLSLRICDPACGSGHFLLAAARRLGKELARVRTGEEEPAPERVRESIREVISHCIYGVDKNPLAVDLCRVALWLEGHTADKPLTFLDHRIRCGDSLVGVFDLTVLKKGIPDDAFNPLEGDDRETARSLKAANRSERRDLDHGQRWLRFDNTDNPAEWSSHSRELDAIADDSPQAIRRKKEIFEQSHKDPAWLHQKQACDLWTAAFFQSLQANQAVISTAALVAHLSGQPIDQRILALAETLASRNRFFHWQLEFPEVFAVGGFDVVLGNPPWEQIQFDPREFFSTSKPEIADAPNMAARDRMINKLKTEDPVQYVSYLEALKHIEGIQKFIHYSGFFPFSSVGRLNTAPCFTELFRSIMASTGRSGIIIPSGIATDSFTQAFFRDMFFRGSISTLFDFENKCLFPAVHRSFKFCLLTLTGTERPERNPVFAFFAHRVENLRDSNRQIVLSAEDIELLNPNTKTCPIFRSRRDAELTKAIYRRVPILLREEQDNQPSVNPWGITFKLMFMMNTDSHLFRTSEQLKKEGWHLQGNVFLKADARYLPLYEAKMIHHFDHRWATYTTSGDTRDVSLAEKQQPDFPVQPRYWVPEAEVDSALAGKWEHGWLMGWRDITNTTNERTVIASVIPRVGVGHTTPLFLTEAEIADRFPFLMVNLSSFTLDYIARQKVGGTHLTYGYLNQIPVLPPETYARLCPWSTADPPLTLRDFLLPRVLELTYTAWDLEPFAHDCGYHGPPFRWDEERRFQLRCELDAAFFHLYLPATPEGRWKPAQTAEGAVVDETPAQLAELENHFPTPRHAVEYILDTFPIVRRKDEDQYGEYRTRRVILAIYDAMAESIRSGQPYQTCLDPPPADPQLPREEPIP